nr:hypothetical protein [Okeania sp. SIO2F4]
MRTLKSIIKEVFRFANLYQKFMLRTEADSLEEGYKRVIKALGI